MVNLLVVMAQDRVTIGSRRSLPPAATNVRPAREDANIEVSLVLRRPDAAPPATPGARPLSQDEFAARYGAAPSDITAVEQFAKAHGIKVTQIDAPRRTVILSGPIRAMNQAFGVNLMNFEIEGRTHLSYSGENSVPRQLGGIVVGVFGLDNLPAATPH